MITKVGVWFLEKCSQLKTLTVDRSSQTYKTLEDQKLLESLGKLIPAAAASAKAIKNDSSAVQTKDQLPWEKIEDCQIQLHLRKILIKTFCV